MNIGLFTDAPRHNLALMKISAHQKLLGDKVFLNVPGSFDKTYGSWLFSHSQKHPCTIEGGPGIDPTIRLNGFDRLTLTPDYTLFNLDYALGYTWSWCPNKCPFCVVSKQKNPREHHSIWDFTLAHQKKICLLNNNTFSDPQWRETFQEIWDADLIVRDENGYDLRLIDQEKAEALAKTKWTSPKHPAFAWDLMENEKAVMCGLSEIGRVGLRYKTIYVLIGFNTTIEEDIYRCQKIHEMKQNPFPMIYEDNGSKPLQHKFRRMIYARYYRKHGNIEQAWKEYAHA